MDVTNISLKFDQVDQIVHISDVHIRLTKRHVEYREAFYKLYKEIRKTPSNTLILVAGDLLHNKVDLSPECVDLASEFLKNLADIRPTIIILGNHDLNLSNNDRMDSISPIVKSLNHKNLFYLKCSGIYRAGDVLFNVMSVLDEPEDYILNKDIPKKYRMETNHLIDLYHGPLDNVRTNLGYTIKNPRMTLEKFDGADYALLGDIHKHLVLQSYDKKLEKPIVVYSSSIIAQDHSENDDMHGFCLWHLKSHKFDYIKIPNDYGFFTAEIKDGKLITNMSNCPSKSKLRLKCFNSGVAEVREVVTEIRKHFDLSEVSYVRIEDDPESDFSKNSENRLEDLNISDVDFQNNLLLDYLQRKEKFVSNEQFEVIKKINKDVNDILPKEESLRNIKWRLKYFEFDNMFAYSDGNKVDFTKLKDVVGLFSTNASGKSSFISALCFCLFDKSDRAFKASNVINSQKMSFRCKVNFEINGVDFWIERRGSRDKKGNVKVNVDFWKIENDEKVELNDEARRGTNAVIRDYIGSFEDFSLTSLALQGKDSAFIEFGQTEKKDLFARFMGINIFDRLYNTATEKFKEITVILKNFKRDDFSEKLAKLENDVIDLEKLNNQFNEEYEVVLKRRDTTNNELMSESKKLITIHNAPDDIDLLIKNKNNTTSRISEIKKELDSINTQLQTTIEDASKIKVSLEEWEKAGVVDKKKSYDDLIEKKKELDHTMALKKVWVEQQLKKLENLSILEYDPNCKFCMNNVFVKDAIKTKEELETEKPNIAKLKDEIDTYERNISELSRVEDDYKLYNKCIQDFSEFKESANRLKRIQLEHQSDLNEENNQLSKIQNDIDLYEESKDILEKNKIIEKNIQSYKKKLADLNELVKSSNKKLMDTNSRLVSVKNERDNIKDNLEKMKQLENEYSAYEYYLECINRDGIPHELITQALPKVENEVNNILAQIVEFTMELKADGKNILTNIVYEDRKWPLELCSGMEKFCSALALRVALTNISSIPKGNFLSCDEGFAALDANHLAMVHSLLSFLKTNFEFVLVISHLDAMKDVVDSHLEIQKNGDFSKINNI
jgi:DNA repair exonuclease SbcCD ATPase subunit